MEPKPNVELDAFLDSTGATHQIVVCPLRIKMVKCGALVKIAQYGKNVAHW